MRITESKINKLSHAIPAVIGVKNLESKFTWISNEGANQLGFSHPDDMLGLSEFEIPLTVRFAENFIENDLSTLSGAPQLFIEDSYWKSFGAVKCVAFKAPIYSDHEPHQICGNLAFVTVLTDKMVQNLFNQILAETIGLQLKPLASEKLHIIPVQDKSLLTIREQEILYYTLRGKSAKNIAYQLNISASTVEFHLNNIKVKFNCFNKQQLIEYAIEHAYHLQIPSSIAEQEKIVDHTCLDFNVIEAMINKYSE